MSKARWMSKILHSIKMVLLSDLTEKELSKGAIFGKRQLSKVKQFVKFVLFVYIPWWITAPVVASYANL